MKISLPGFLFAAMTLASHAPCANAQTVAPGEPPEEIDGKLFREYANSHEYFDRLAQATMRYEMKIGPCATPKEVVRIRAGRPQIPSRIPKLGIPPQWMEVLKVSGCEKPVIRPVLVVYANKKLIIAPLISGEGLSRFDVILQRDVIATLMTTEHVLAKRAGCSGDAAVRILNTRMLSKKTVEAGLVWEEEWQLANCKGEKRVKIGYEYHDNRGTDFTISQVGAE